jgi:hypothetical protein
MGESGTCTKRVEEKCEEDGGEEDKRNEKGRMVRVVRDREEEEEEEEREAQMQGSEEKKEESAGYFVCFCLFVVLTANKEGEKLKRTRVWTKEGGWVSEKGRERED